MSAPGRERTRTDKQYDAAPALHEPGPERRGPDGPLPLPFLVRVESTGNGSKRRERNSSRSLLAKGLLRRAGQTHPTGTITRRDRASRRGRDASGRADETRSHGDSSSRPPNQEVGIPGRRRRLHSEVQGGTSRALTPPPSPSTAPVGPDDREGTHGPAPDSCQVHTGGGGWREATALGGAETRGVRHAGAGGQHEACAPHVLSAAERKPRFSQSPRTSLRRGLAG